MFVFIGVLGKGEPCYCINLKRELLVERWSSEVLSSVSNMAILIYSNLSNSKYGHRYITRILQDIDIFRKIPNYKTSSSSSSSSSGLLLTVCYCVM